MVTDEAHLPASQEHVFPHRVIVAVPHAWWSFHYMQKVVAVFLWQDSDIALPGTRKMVSNLTCSIIGARFDHPLISTVLVFLSPPSASSLLIWVTYVPPSEHDDHPVAPLSPWAVTYFPASSIPKKNLMSFSSIILPLTCALCVLPCSGKLRCGREK